MVARIDVRSLVKRAKEELQSTDVARDINKSYGALAAETLRLHAQQQTCLDLTESLLRTELQVGSLSCRSCLAGVSCLERFLSLDATAAQEVFYLPDFLSQDEELQLLTAVDAAPASRWTNAGERKMQNWGGRPGERLIQEVRGTTGRGVSDNYFPCPDYLQRAQGCNAIDDHLVTL